MPGTLFLDALKRKQALEKGYPLKDRGVASERDLYAQGNTGDPLWAVHDRLARSIGRLQATAEKAVANESPEGTSSPYEAVRERLKTEQVEGEYRNKPGVTTRLAPR